MNIEIKNETTLQGEELTVISWLENGVLYRDPTEGPAQVKYYYNKHMKTWHGTALVETYTLTRTQHCVYNHAGLKMDGDTTGHLNSPHVSYWKVQNDGSKVVHREHSEGPAVYTVESCDYLIDGRQVAVYFMEYYQDGKLHRPLADGPARIEHKKGKYDLDVHSYETQPSPASTDIYKITYALNGQIHHPADAAVEYLNQAAQHCSAINRQPERFYHYGVDYTDYKDQLAELGLQEGTAEWEFTLEMLRA